MKKLEIIEREATQARLYDRETTTRITRRVDTNPMPEKRIPLLAEQFQDLALRHDVMNFLDGRQSLAAWQARQLLGRPDAADDALRQTSIEQRLEEQSEDGSWAGAAIATARNLRELLDLGLSQTDDPVQRAAGWLLARPQSAHNPGMLFAAEALVAEQAQIVAQRQAGKGAAFANSWSRKRNA